MNMSKKKRAKNKSTGIKDSEVVREKMKKQLKSSKKSKLEEALELNKQAREPMDIGDTGKVGTWIGRIATVGFVGYWILAAMMIFSALSGNMNGMGGGSMIQLVYTLSPILLTSVCIWYLVAFSCLRFRRNPIRQRRLNGLLPWCLASFVLFLISFVLSMPGLFVFGYPILTIAAVVLNLIRLSRDRWEINRPTAEEEKRIERKAVILIVADVIVIVIGLAVSYQFFDFMKVILEFSDKAMPVDATALLCAFAA